MRGRRPQGRGSAGPSELSHRESATAPRLREQLQPSSAELRQRRATGGDGRLGRVRAGSSRSSLETRRARNRGSAGSRGLAEPSALRGEQLLPAGGDTWTGSEINPLNYTHNYSLKHPPGAPELCPRHGLYGIQHREQSSGAHSSLGMPSLGGNVPFTLLHANSNFNQLKISFVLLTKLPRMMSDIF